MAEETREGILVARVVIEKYLTEDADDIWVRATDPEGEGLNVIEGVGLCYFAADDLLRQSRGE